MKFFGLGIARKLGLGKKNRKFLLKLMPSNSVCAEIGVFCGNLSEDILKITKPEKLYLIDPWFLQDAEYLKTNIASSITYSKERNDQRYQLVKNKFENNPVVTIIRAKSETALMDFPDNFFDWVYIDGDHSYEAVLKDLELCLRTVKPQGYIAGDDFGIDTNPHKAVRKAVMEFLTIAPVELITIKKFQFIIKSNK